MSNLEDLADRPLLEIWGDAVRARRVQGEKITLAIVELAPNAVVPEHVHPNEQLGICLRGSGTFTLEDRPPFPPSEQIEATFDAVLGRPDPDYDAKKAP